MKSSRTRSRTRSLTALLLVVQLLSACMSLAAQPRRRATTPPQRASFGGLAWPRVTQQAKPWTRWWWLGSAVNRRDLSTEMAK